MEGGEREDGGALQSGASATFERYVQLLTHEMIEERGGRVIARDGFLRSRMVKCKCQMTLSGDVFLNSNLEACKESFLRRFSEAPTTLVWALLVVLLEPCIHIGL
jgi:hypothetical protein